MPPLRIFLLGRFEVAVDSEPMPDELWRRRKARSLIKLLALAGTHRLLRDQLIETLWPEQTPESGANSLHQTLHIARHAFSAVHAEDAQFLRLDQGSLCLAPAGGLWVDVEAFETAGLAARRSRDPAAYQAALALYRGDLLPEDLYEEWASARREELRLSQLALLLALAGLHGERAEHSLAIETLRRVLAVEPAHEEAHRGLMRHYDALGDRRQALRQYQILRESLERDLAVEPDAESEALYREIAAGSRRVLLQGAAGDAVPPAAARLAPPRTGPAEAAVPEAARPARPARHNLPQALTSFIGRERETLQVRRLLATTRLATLTGPGGCGKTRLALEVAATALNDYRDGIWLVELGALVDAAFVGRTVASALGAPETAGQPAIDALMAALRDRQLLLILDNCEHLLEPCAVLAEALLRACPDLRILATSRERLRAAGEMSWLVPSLAMPDPRNPPPFAEIRRFEAVRLFSERAAAVAQGFSVTPENAQAVIELCFRLDGMPLALELAAARANLLSPAQILARLNDRFRLLSAGSRAALSRQQTLRATIDWSHDLLDPDERLLFRRLAVFAGSFNLETVESVCSGAGLATENILDLLARLVDSSLVLADPAARRAAGEDDARYRLLESTREYALARLDEAGETEERQGRLAGRCLEWVTQARRRLWGPEHAAALDALEQEIDNLRSALGWQQRDAARHAEAGLALAVGLWQFWIQRGYLAEGRHWLAKLLAAAPQPARLRGLALQCAGALAWRAGEPEAVRPWLEESIAIARVLGDGPSGRRAQQLLGALAWLRGAFDEAQACFESALAGAREDDDAAGQSAAAQLQGVLAASRSDYAAAEDWMCAGLEGFRGLHDQAEASWLFINLPWSAPAPRSAGRWWIVEAETLVQFREIGAASAVGSTLANLGILAWMRGDPSAAWRRLEESRAQFETAGDHGGLGQVLSQLGSLADWTGDPATAQALLEQSLVVRRAIGDCRGIGRSLGNLANLAVARGEYARGRELLDEALALFGQMGDRPGLASAQAHLADLALAEGDLASAAVLWQESLSHFRRIGVKRPTAVLLLNLGVLAILSGNLGPAASHLESSRALFVELGDRRGADAAGRELAQLGPPPPHSAGK